MSPKALEIAKNMLAMNIDEATILKLTGLSLDEFRQLKFLKFNKDRISL
ncbi:hypothetical protein [Segatella copri]|jgi:predicted transposase YdaD|nr:hypothetical protein [Segatella copri]